MIYSVPSTLSSFSRWFSPYYVKPIHICKQWSVKQFRAINSLLRIRNQKCDWTTILIWFVSLKSTLQTRKYAMATSMLKLKVKLVFHENRWYQRIPLIPTRKQPERTNHELGICHTSDVVDQAFEYNRVFSCVIHA